MLSVSQGTGRGTRACGITATDGELPDRPRDADGWRVRMVGPSIGGGRGGSRAAQLNCACKLHGQGPWRSFLLEEV
jgi:hypothetical protein